MWFLTGVSIIKKIKITAFSTKKWCKSVYKTHAAQRSTVCIELCGNLYVQFIRCMRSAIEVSRERVSVLPDSVTWDQTQRP